MMKSDLEKNLAIAVNTINSVVNWIFAHPMAFVAILLLTSFAFVFGIVFVAELLLSL